MACSKSNTWGFGLGHDQPHRYICLAVADSNFTRAFIGTLSGAKAIAKDLSGALPQCTFWLSTSQQVKLAQSSRMTDTNVVCRAVSNKWASANGFTCISTDALLHLSNKVLNLTSSSLLKNLDKELLDC
ncbi:hypothetical protein PCASD_10844 [Puccinia coronata f. sp. avenae]|uniref:Uncharacterized protein n=1 Tax=Puccinia coronata f. sp. avenae TaxID=200324 RepID=A0A2N5UU79_9BASI|nr:hypothetical protein PCASD_10844 [Puccinia coronata f. sp. avenae]